MLLFRTLFTAGGEGLHRVLLLDTRQLGLLGKSAALGLCAALCCLSVGVPAAFFIERTDIAHRELWRWALCLPLLIPPYMHALLWSRFLDICFAAAGAAQRVVVLEGFSGALFVFTVAYFPLVVLFTGAGFHTVDRSLEEVSLSRRSPAATIASITLPLAAPCIAASGILVFMFVIVNFEVPDMLRLHVYPIEIFINFAAYYDERAATMLSTPLIGLGMFLVYVLTRLLRKRSYALLRGTHRMPYRIPLQKARAPVYLFLGMCVVCALGIPLGTMVTGVGGPNALIRACACCGDTIVFSILIALGCGVCMVAVAFPVAYFFHRVHNRLRDILYFCMLIPLGVPSIVMGIGLIQMWNRPLFAPMYESPFMLLLALASVYTPVIVVVLHASMAHVPLAWEEAARSAPSSTAGLFIRIVVLPCIPAMLVGFGIGFALAMGNLGTALLIVSPGNTTVPITIYNYMHYGADETMYALSGIVIGCVGVCTAAVFPLYKISKRWMRL
jgi:iron(III) transport system permease protein